MLGRACSDPRRRGCRVAAARHSEAVGGKRTRHFGPRSVEVDPELPPILHGGRRAKQILPGAKKTFLGTTYADPRHAFSIRQHYLTPLDLIVAKTSRYLAIRTSDRRIAGDRNPELWIVTLIDGLLKCNKPCARWITAPNGEVPLCR